MNRNPLQRLGANGGQEVREHPFFASIDWDALYRRTLIPPFDPLRNQTEIDTKNFEREFTNMPVSLDASGREPRGGDADTLLVIENFTYEEESYLNSLIENRSSSFSRHK